MVLLDPEITLITCQNFSTSQVFRESKLSPLFHDSFGEAILEKPDRKPLRPPAFNWINWTCGRSLPQTFKFECKSISKSLDFCLTIFRLPTMITARLEYAILVGLDFWIGVLRLHAKHGNHQFPVTRAPLQPLNFASPPILYF